MPTDINCVQGGELLLSYEQVNENLTIVLTRTLRVHNRVRHLDSAPIQGGTPPDGASKPAHFEVVSQ
jgi:hypothetical protein